jgi:hypothetical protein
MADKFWTLQLALPCRVNEATEWWEEVNRVIGDDTNVAEVSVIEHTDGHPRLTVHLADRSA